MFSTIIARSLSFCPGANSRIRIWYNRSPRSACHSSLALWILTRIVPAVVAVDHYECFQKYLVGSGWWCHISEKRIIREGLHSLFIGTYYPWSLSTKVVIMHAQGGLLRPMHPGNEASVNLVTLQLQAAEYCCRKVITYSVWQNRCLWCTTYIFYFCRMDL